jgi:hypothetical protein
MAFESAPRRSRDSDGEPLEDIRVTGQARTALLTTDSSDRLDEVVRHVPDWRRQAGSGLWRSGRSSARHDRHRYPGAFLDPCLLEMWARRRARRLTPRAAERIGEHKSTAQIYTQIVGVRPAQVVNLVAMDLRTTGVAAARRPTAGRPVHWANVDARPPRGTGRLSCEHDRSGRYPRRRRLRDDEVGAGGGG